MVRVRREWHFVDIKLLIAAIATIVSSAAIAGISANMLFYESRFAELEVLMEQEVPDLSKGRSDDRLYLYSAYFQLKKYSKLFPCLDQWEHNTDNGDAGGFMVGGDIGFMSYVYRAEASMELGDYPSAVRHAKRAYEYVTQKQLSDKKKFFPLGALSLAYALNGQPEKALEHAQLLDNLGGTLGAMLSVRPVGLANVYLVLGDFEKCVATMDQESGRRGILGAIGHSIGAGMGLLAFHELPKQIIDVKRWNLVQRYAADNGR